MVNCLVYFITIYLQRNFNFPKDNAIAVNSACNFKQEIRHKYLIDWVCFTKEMQLEQDESPPDHIENMRIESAKTLSESELNIFCKSSL